MVDREFNVLGLIIRLAVWSGPLISYRELLSADMIYGFEDVKEYEADTFGAWGGGLMF